MFDTCHGCRRCVSLCGAFPALFDAVDESATMEVDGVAKSDYVKVVDQRYLCDVCYMTKCPYVPPQQWNVDFPHLMLRWRDWLKPALRAVLRSFFLADSRVADGPMSALTALTCLACAFVWLPASAMAQSSLPLPKFDEGEVKEIDAPPLPVYPKPSSLIKFPTSWSTGDTFIDGDTLVINDDRVVRYTLVIKSAGGAENVTFEGLRCETGERRVYAFGRRDGTWSVARTSAWRPIDDSRINRQHFEFWRDVFCDGKVIELRARLIANIKRGGRKREQGSPAAD